MKHRPPGERRNSSPSQPPLTPALPASTETDMLDRQQMLASLENRLNGQQKRISDNEAFIVLLKKEALKLRKLVDDLRAAYFQNLAPRPVEKTQ